MIELQNCDLSTITLTDRSLRPNGISLALLFLLLFIRILHSFDLSTLEIIIVDITQLAKALVRFSSSLQLLYSKFTNTNTRTHVYVCIM